MIMLIVLLSILVAVFIILSVLSFLQKGPLISELYFFSDEKERKKMKTKDWYYYIGTSFLMISILFGISLAEEAFNVTSLQGVRIVTIIILILYVIVRYVQIESKRIKNQ